MATKKKAPARKQERDPAATRERSEPRGRRGPAGFTPAGRKGSDPFLIIKPLTHLDARGQARMVDIGDKAITQRVAVARGRVEMERATLELLVTGRAVKGDVLAAARIAGIQASKRTPELIPLCHTVALTKVELEFTPDLQNACLEIEARAQCVDRTGVEMEALTAVSVAALTIYDMLKSRDRGMSIEGVALYAKSGGKSGDWTR